MAAAWRFYFVLATLTVSVYCGHKKNYNANQEISLDTVNFPFETHTWKFIARGFMIYIVEVSDALRDVRHSEFITHSKADIPISHLEVIPPFGDLVQAQVISRAQ